MKLFWHNQVECTINSQMKCVIASFHVECFNTKFTPQILQTWCLRSTTDISYLHKNIYIMDKRQNKWLINPKFKCCSQCDQVSEVKVDSVHIFFWRSQGRERTPPPELYSFAYKALQPRKMGSSEPEVQGIHGRKEKIKQHNTPTTHKTSHTAGGDQETKTQHNTTKERRRCNRTASASRD